MSILLVNVVCPYILSADSVLVVQRKRSSIRLWMLRSKAAPYCILSCDLQGETSALPLWFIPLTCYVPFITYFLICRTIKRPTLRMKK